MILGAVLLLIATLFSGSVATLLRLFPTSILGVILFLTGAQLALGSCHISKDKAERFVTIATSALAVWNVGIAFRLRHGWLLARHAGLAAGVVVDPFLGTCNNR